MPIFLQHIHLILVICIITIASSGLGTWTQLNFHRMFSKNVPFVPLPFFLTYFIGQVIFSSLMVIVSLFFSQSVTLFILTPLLILSFALAFFFKIINPTALIQHFRLTLLPLYSILILILGFHFIYSFHKPSEWDEVAYHYPVVKEIAEGNLNFPLLQASSYNSFYHPFSFFYGSLPYGSEAFAAMVYLFSHHPSSAHLIFMVNFYLFLLFVEYFLKKLYQADDLTTISIMIFLASNYRIVQLLTTGLIDINVLIYQFLAIALAILGKKNHQLLWFPLSAMCMGFALGQKFTTIFILPLYIPLLFLWIRQLTHRWIESLKIFGVLALSGGFWYLKNTLLHLNPVYPLYLGHLGLTNEEYAFLKDTLIDGLRAPLTIPSLLKVLKLNYAIETSTVILAGLFVLAVIFKRIKLHWYDYVLLGFAVLIYICNFAFGSQVSRYVMLAPLVVHLVAAPILTQRKSFTLLLVLVVLFLINKDPDQKALWKHRYQELPHVFALGYTIHDTQKIGCPAAVFHFCQENCLKGAQVLNLWDAYAASFYADAHFFYSVNQEEDLDTWRPPNHVKYLFINNSLKKITLEGADLHRDMQPEKRAELEIRLIGNQQPLFVKDHCELYAL
jgi:hypothetical protein